MRGGGFREQRGSPTSIDRRTRVDLLPPSSDKQDLGETDLHEKRGDAAEEWVKQVHRHYAYEQAEWRGVGQVGVKTELGEEAVEA